MNIFGVHEAKHFCKNFQKTLGPETGSLESYIASALSVSGAVKEGTPQFNSYRDCLLRETERCVFLAISNYRRSLDLMTPGASSWAYVTLYYSSFFAAKALLGMFGGWAGPSKTIIDVAVNQPGKQELIRRKMQTTYGGSHEQFWDSFYAATASLGNWVDPKLKFAITPVSGSITWQTDNRNEVNYDSFIACQLALSFQSNFSLSRFPGSLPGKLATQHSVTEGLLLIVAKFVREFGLVTDALNGLRPAGTRRAKIQCLVFQDRAPSLVKKTKCKSLLV